MKKKFSKILGVGLTVALLSSLILIAAPVSAGTLGWSAFSPVPSSTNQVLVDNVSVTDIAIYDADTIYAAGGSNLLYKSTDGGVAWGTIDTDNHTDLVVVAPDDSDIVVYADTDNLSVWITINGGTTWGGWDMDADMDVINDIAISAESAGTHYIAVVGDNESVAEVFSYNLGAGVPGWKNIGALSGFTHTANSTVAAVAFSPNFPSDQVMVVVSYNGNNVDTGTDNITLELFSENQDVWNTFDGYPAIIVSDDAITGLDSASIALGPDYLGSDDAMRMSFIGLTVAGLNTEATDESGIHRMDDYTHKALKDGTAVKIYSITYDGLTLVAGRYDSNVCYYSTDPTATTPTVSGTRSWKRPGMSDNTLTVVAWAGDNVVAGTSGNSSAFAVSRNNGKSFNDISLIDTVDAVTGNITDVAVSADASITYMATCDTDGLSLWRYASAWERVLAIPNEFDFIVRVAPDDPDVVFVADKGGTAIYYSADGGEERWQARTFRYTEGVADLAVEGEGGVAYVAVSGTKKVSKSTNSGFTWGTFESTKLSGDINMIVSLGEDKVLVGGYLGYVAYSTDGNESWTKIGKIIESSALLVQATASGLATDDYIYAASSKTDTAVLRWQLGTSTSWKDLKAPTSGNYSATGIALQDDVLYVMTEEDNNSDNDSEVLRTLEPTHAVPDSGRWSTIESADEAFNLTPQALKVGGGSTTLWAIDTDTNALWSYADTLTDTAPTLVSPKHGSSIAVNPVTGYAMDVAFTWLKPSDNVLGYQLKIALDEGFDETVKSVTYDGTSSTVSSPVGKDTDYAYSFMPGTTYYWRVRVYDPVYSPYSIVYSLTVEEAEAPFPVVTVEAPPPAPAPQVTVTPPEITVEVPPITIPAAPAIPAYLLWTIIGIGAVLIIALIVLIVRTRRVV